MRAQFTKIVYIPMSTRQKCFLSCPIVVLFLVSCQRPSTEQSSNRMPSATEVFELRTKCAVMGEKIMEDNIIGTALMHQQISRYNPITNRCYIKLEVSTADLGTPQERFVRSQYLFDGQTKEMLASASWEGLNKKTAYLFPDNLKSLSHDPPAYEEVDAIIERFMAEERKP